MEPSASKLTPVTSSENTFDVTYDLFCPECDYNLRDLPERRCPECGTDFDPTTLRVSRIPWVHRKELGFLRAYWKTVRLVMFRTTQFSQERCRPVDYRDAQRFRWLTILHVYVPVFVACAYAFGRALVRGEYEFDSRFLEAIIWSTAQFCGVLFVVAMTGVPSYLFHPRYLSIEQQNRAVALSYYACAALALTPLTCVLGLASWAMYDAMMIEAGGTLFLLFACAAAAQILVYWIAVIQLASRTSVARANHTIVVAVTVPLMWIFVGGTISVGISFVVGYFTIALLMITQVAWT